MGVITHEELVKRYNGKNPVTSVTCRGGAVERYLQNISRFGDILKWREADNGNLLVEFVERPSSNGIVNKVGELIDLIDKEGA